MPISPTILPSDLSFEGVKQAIEKERRYKGLAPGLSPTELEYMGLPKTGLYLPAPPAGTEEAVIPVAPIPKEDVVASAGMVPQAPPRATAAPTRVPITPAGFVPTTRSMERTEMIPVSPEARENLAKAEQHALLAAGLEERAALDESALRREALAEEIRSKQQLNEERAKLAEREAANSAENQRKIVAIADEVTAASDIGEHKYWEDKGTFAQMMGALTVALGGFQQGYAGGGPNYAAEAIDRLVQRDIQRQVRTLETKKEKLGEAKSLYALARQQYADKDAALVAAQISGLELAKLGLAQQLTLVQDQRTLATGQKALGAIADKQYEKQVKLDEMTGGKITIKEAEKYMPAMGGIAAPKDLPPELMSRYTPLFGGKLMKDAAAATKMADESAAALNLIQKAQELKALLAEKNALGKKDPTGWFSSKRARLESIYAEMAAEKNVLFGQGAMSQGDKENIEKSLGNVTAFGDTPVRVIEDGARRTLRRVENRARAYGIFEIPKKYTPPVNVAGPLTFPEAQEERVKPEGGIE